MNPFFFALLIILSGGTASLLWWKNPHLVKTLPVIAITSGSTVGLFSAFNNFIVPHSPAIEWLWLGRFPLSFRMDPLSAFFLIPVFGIALLAALYSF